MSTTAASPSTTEQAPTELPAGESRPPVVVSWPAAEQGGLRAAGRSLLPREAGQPVWHHIDRSPKRQPRTRQVSPGGTTMDIDDDGVMTEHGSDGSSDMWLPGGDHIHIGPDGDFTENKGEGTFDSFEDDGTHTHLGPDGDYVEDPDGTRHFFDPDGGGWDLPPLVSLPGPAGKEPSGAVGEPHYLSEDGVGITTQVLGEFQLTAGAPGQAIQARVQPYLDSTKAAAITALAFDAGGSKVSVYVDGRVVVGGELAPEGSDLQGDLTGGGAIGVWRDSAGKLETMAVVWPDLSVARVQARHGWLDLQVQWRHGGGGRTGLLGSDDGNAANDLTDRDGTVVDPNDQAQIDGLARSWRIAAESSMFEYQPGESPAAFAIDDFPTEAASQPDPDSVPECADVLTDFARAACAYDITVTGDPAFTASAAAFGAALAADALRRASLTYVSEHMASLTGGAGSPAPSNGVFALTDKDRAAAEPTQWHGGLTAVLAGAESKTYRIDLGGTASLGAFNNNLSCPNQPWTDGQGGYALFAADGAVLIGPRQACDDLPRGNSLPPGSYYLKLSGPGTFDLSLQTYVG